MMKIPFLFMAAIALVACSTEPTQTVQQSIVAETPTPSASQVKTPEWAKDAVIYQINTRQYSEAGTFEAVEADLARVKALGVDILWFMPIHPIGEEKRKGSMGSPYAVNDFQSVNSDLGTLEDFKSLVDAAHALDMKVIIDWVANHTAWDNHLIKKHPEWYSRNADGEMQHPPETDWVDVADLDYSQEGLRNYMTESLLYWVRDVGIDGYRCDVAGMVPTDFWEDARSELDAIKPVFMLAEWQTPELHEKAFDASYAWRWKEVMQSLVKGEADVSDVAGYYRDYLANWPNGAMRMAYTENHDQNSWDGPTGEIYGEALQAAMALSFVGDGIPLIYNGQEAGNQKRLEFFEKDIIDWNAHPHNELITELSRLKEENDVLWNGAWGAPLEILETSNDKEVFSFIRRREGRAIFAVYNLSGSPVSVTFGDSIQHGDYKTFITDVAVNITAETNLSLEPWDYRIYIR